ncbi:VOC family protein [Caballeronia sp. Lep1P3]|uniref:VOC family protein n=1 Tax=Caballeronia sp. Lep1P3 TaxID=2878150 RepID=UPI001FD4E403|nr:VOC family protein [Caballeronia sp. Lep1P3]
MSQILALRPFVPAKDFSLSKRFYEALGFRITHEDERMAMLKTESFSFILQNFYAKEFAENCMLQLLVRDVDAWWQQTTPEALAGPFQVNAARAPSMQSWGMKVGFIFDPSGVLWHVAEVPF